jgi:poly-gamma-glutamate system protein
MFRPQIQKTRVLISMAIFSLFMVYLATESTVIHTTVGIDEKLRASEIMESALNVLKYEIRDIRRKTIYIDIDPNTTGLIFKEDSPIRSSIGDLEAKQTVLKPNFAAVVVDHLIQAGVSSGDTVAIGMTGSMPGANIAVLSACKAMGVHTVNITSVGSSTWGATDPNFTWLDMETVLVDSGVFTQKSIAASMGGKGDCLRRSGKRGGKEGRKIVKRAANRNGIPLIEYVLPIEENNVSKSIEQRVQFYSEVQGELKNYAAFINVGGGVTNVGVGGKKKFPKPGFFSSETILEMNPRNSIIQNFAQVGVPTIHVSHISQLVKGIIPFGSEKLKTGQGRLYKEERYNLLVAGIALILSLGLVVGVGIYSHEQIKKRMQSYEPESIL